MEEKDIKQVDRKQVEQRENRKGDGEEEVWRRKNQKKREK